MNFSIEFLLSVYHETYPGGKNEKDFGRLYDGEEGDDPLVAKGARLIETDVYYFDLSEYYGLNYFIFEYEDRYYKAYYGETSDNGNMVCHEDLDAPWGDNPYVEVFPKQKTVTVYEEINH